MNTQKPLTDQQQRRYLKDRIDEIKSSAARKRWKIQETKEEPAEIKAARKTIEKYEKQRMKRNDREIKRLKLDPDIVANECRAARQAMLFLSPADALEELRKLEKKYPY